jgi:hypothetical protein
VINQNFVFLGAFIFFFGSIGYFIETLQGKVKPNKVTWFLWSLAPFIAFFAEISQGVGIQSLLIFMFGFIPLTIFFASFVNKKSYWKISKTDILCGSLSVIGIILWKITSVGNIAIIFSIISDLLASLPTIIKAYKNPETENSTLFFANAFSATITLLTVKTWVFQEYGFVSYIFLDSLLIAILVKFKIGKIAKNNSK